MPLAISLCIRLVFFLGVQWIAIHQKLLHAASKVSKYDALGANVRLIYDYLVHLVEFPHWFTRAVTCVPSRLPSCILPAAPTCIPTPRLKRDPL